MKPAADSTLVTQVRPVVAKGATYSRYWSLVQARNFLMHLSWLSSATGILVPFIPYLSSTMVQLTGISPFVALVSPIVAYVVLVVAILVLTVTSRRTIQYIARASAVYCALPLCVGFARNMGLYGIVELSIFAFGLLLLSIGFALLSGVISSGGLVRIVLLRPFGQAQMTVALKRVIRNHLAAVGHIFTLSDRHFRPSIAMIGLGVIGEFRHLFAPILRPSLREAVVDDELSYRNLVAALSPGFEAVAKSVYSGGQAFNIATSDAWWQRAIELMLNSSEIVLMDISKVGAGSAWEIERLRDSGMIAKTIFIAQNDHASSASLRLTEMLRADRQPAVHEFNRWGDFENPDAFVAALKDRLSDALNSLPDSQ